MEQTVLTWAEFDTLIGALAAAWERSDAETAAGLFAEDAIYMEPPDRQLFRGRTELAAYFGPLEEGTYLEIHGSWFDEARQRGAIEFTFGVDGQEQADHGVAVVSLRNGLMSSWREYHYKGPADFEVFTAASGKSWEWHAGNYP